MFSFVARRSLCANAAVRSVPTIHLTVVKCEYEGDAFFPPFEDKFELVEEMRDTPDFKILHNQHKSLAK